MSSIEAGKKAPAFTLPNQDGEKVALRDLAGQDVVVYFYPRDDTPGCTKEACHFRDLQSAFDAVGVSVLGISADSVRAQGNFSAKHTLSMPLLSDPERTVLEAWGIWGEKKNYGRTYMGIIRSTFLFDAEGTLVEAWRKVRVKGHADAVLERARSLTEA